MQSFLRSDVVRLLLPAFLTACVVAILQLSLAEYYDSDNVFIFAFFAALFISPVLALLLPSAQRRNRLTVLLYIFLLLGGPAVYFVLGLLAENYLPEIYGLSTWLLINFIFVNWMLILVWRNLMGRDLNERYPGRRRLANAILLLTLSGIVIAFTLFFVGLSSG